MKQFIRHEVSKQFIRKYLTQIVIYTVGISAVAAISYLICRRRVWYGNETWYSLLHFVNENLVSTFLFTLLFGCVVISCIHFRRIAKMLEMVTQAVDDLYANRINFVRLPAELHEVEKTLNQIINQVQESSRIAKEAEQRKNDMVVYMAHDLKTPLTSVIGYLTLLKDEKQLSEKLREKYLAVAWRKSEWLEELINEFFEVTRINFTCMTLNYSVVNMQVMLEQILYEFKPLFLRKEMTYELELAPSLMVSCDVEKMERVFDNLIKNAINYSYEKSVLYLSLQANGENGMKVVVKNKGKTIPKEKIDRIFEQFFRLDTARNSETGGSGLGLAIAKQIVELHGGKISCESENETITFVLEI